MTAKSLRIGLWLGLALATLLLWVPSARAAEVVVQNIYVLKEGETVSENLYVSSSEVVIDGVVDGDLVAIATLVTIDGRVTGDVIVAGSGLEIAGVVEGDVRSLVAGIEIDGQVGGDVLATGGATNPFASEVGAPTGIQFLNDAQIGGDVMLFGTQAELRGLIEGRLLGNIASLTFNGLTIEEGASISMGAFVSDEESRVLGDGLRYESVAPLNVPSQIADTIEYVEIEQPGTDWMLVLRSIVGIIAGSALIGWVILRFQPILLVAPASVLAQGWGQPLRTGISVVFAGSLGVGFVAITAGIFWGFGAFFALAGLFAMLLAFVWYVSPMILGMFIALRTENPNFTGYIIGVSILAILTQLPTLGGAIHFAIFIAGLGAMLSAQIFPAEDPTA